MGFGKRARPPEDEIALEKMSCAGNSEGKAILYWEISGISIEKHDIVKSSGVHIRSLSLQTMLILR
jgi:hypothetical protein